MTVSILSNEETQALLTRGDLQLLERWIDKGVLTARLSQDKPYIQVRGKAVPLFHVMTLIGTL